MFFSRVQLAGDSLQPATLSRLLAVDGYRAHQSLWRLFSTGAGADRLQSRPYIFRQLEGAAWPTFYIVSSIEPRDADEYWCVETKPFEPQLTTGMQLRFDLRANPVVKRIVRSNGETKQVRHDVVMDAKKRADDFDRRELEQRAGSAWLGARAEKLGFRISPERVLASGYRQHRLPRRGSSPIRFSTLDLEGVLEVSEPDRLRRALFEGVGPSKSFGCGLLLVRPL